METLLEPIHFSRYGSASALQLATADSAVRPSLEKLGDLDTLPERIQAEVAASNTVVSWMALIGAWSRTATTQASD